MAAQLAYWRQQGRFPDDEADLAPAVVGHLAAQVGVGADALDGYDWGGRTGRRHRRAILGHLAIVGFDEAAETAFRCKEVWVAGADRFRSPDEDLPADFAARRTACYERLGLPVQARTFTEALRAEMAVALSQLDRGMPRNPGVRLVPRRRHPIVVRPLEPQPEPPGLGALKVELGRRWPMTGLLDVLKEADRCRCSSAWC